MDSNFQVKITADISALQASLKGVQAELSKFSGAADNAGNSMKKGASDANRMSLAAFALGQVVRDSGFFAQNFALGILAISNNIPILIDQLTKLLALSAGVASAISLVGSVLTAGLTIWAYSAMAAKDAGEEYKKALFEADKSAQGQIATFNALLSIARDVNLSHATRKQAVDKLNESHDGLKKTLTVENANSKESIRLTNQLAQAMLLQAQATALAGLAGEAFANKTRAQNTLIREQAGTWANVKAYVMKSMGFFTDSEKMLLTTGLANQKETIKESEAAYKRYSTELEGIFEKIAKLQLLSTGKPKGDKGQQVEDTPYQSLQESLDAINVDPTTSKLEKLNSEMGAYRTAIKTLIDANVNQASPAFLDLVSKLDSTGKAYETLKTSTENSEIATKKQEQALKDLSTVADGLKNKRLDIADTLGIKNSDRIKREYDAIADAIRQFEQIGANNPMIAQFTNLSLVISLLKNQLLSLQKDFTESFKIEEAIAQANQSVLSLARTVGGDLVNAFNNMLETGKFSFAGLRDALLGTIKTLVSAIAAAAILSIILGTIFPKATNTGFKDIFKVLSGLNLMSDATPMANGGIVSGPTRALVGEYAGARNNPEVIAPLDKLQAILSNTMGDTSNSAMIAETRISGNDLAILVTRANKNRNAKY